MGNRLTQENYEHITKRLEGEIETLDNLNHAKAEEIRKLKMENDELAEIAYSKDQQLSATEREVHKCTMEMRVLNNTIDKLIKCLIKSYFCPTNHGLSDWWHDSAKCGASNGAIGDDTDRDLEICTRCWNEALAEGGEDDD